MVKKDDRVGVEIDFWETYADSGITKAEKFRSIFNELDGILGNQQYLLTEGLSVLDIAWFIYANRLGLAGYPIGRLHPNLGKWYERMEQMPEIAKEIELPPPVRENFAATRAEHLAEGMHLEAVAGL